MAKIKEIARKLEDGSYEKVSLGATNVSELNNDSNFISADDEVIVDDVVTSAETTSNKVTEINENSTDEEYPSAKAVYAAIDTAVNSALEEAY